MSNENQARVQKGVPGHAGEWKATPKDESTAPPLAQPKDITIPVQFDARIDYGPTFNELPEWPASLPIPEVNFGFDGGDLEVYFTSGDASWTVRDGGEETGKITDMFDSYHRRRPEFDSWDGDDLGDVAEWSDSVFDRIDSNVYGLTLSATGSRDVSSAIIAAAVEKPFEPFLAPIFTPEELEKSQPKRAVTRAEKSLSAWFAEHTGDSLDTDEETLQDALSDLMHWADAQGIEFSDVLGTARNRYAEEVVDESEEL